MKKNVIPLVIIAMVVAVLSTGVFYGLVVSRMDGSAPAAPPAVEEPVKPKVKEIPLGLRAVTVHVADSGSVVKLLKAGDRVDVQQVIHRQAAGQMVVEARTILENVVVYDIPEVVNPNMQGRTVMTLLSTPGEAEKLAAADAGSRVRVVLRNPKDEAVTPPPAPKVSSRFVPQMPGAAPERTPVEFAVKLFHLEEGALSAIDPALNEATLQVSRSEWAFAQLEREDKLKLVKETRMVAGKAGEYAWKGAGGQALRVRVEPVAGGGRETRLRIVPEAMAAAGTRRVETQVSLRQQEGALVSGLEPGLMVWIEPVSKP